MTTHGNNLAQTENKILVVNSAFLNKRAVSFHYISLGESLGARVPKCMILSEVYLLEVYFMRK